MSEDHNRKGFVYTWRIENFPFCFHKTGEHLESPLFHTDSPIKTSWRLWLYPRGEDDGEYVSCYLYREEGGPDVVDADFELSLAVKGALVKHPVSFEKIYSFKANQREGDKCFTWRREIFSIGNKTNFPLVFRCKIFNRKGDRLEGPEHFGRTTIDVESTYGMKVISTDAESDSKFILEFDIKDPLQVDALLSIHLVYDNRKIHIEIRPEKCGRIKYAFCKITILASWIKETPIEHVRYWMEEPEEDIFCYFCTLKETESDAEACRDRAVFCHYIFKYSIGGEYANNEVYDYGSTLLIENLSLLEQPNENVKNKEPSEFLTVADALKSQYETETSADVTIKTKKSEHKAHKVILCARSSKLTEMLVNNPECIEILDYTDNIVSRFLNFLYTDDVDDVYYPIAIELYRMARTFKVDLLGKKCTNILKRKRNVKNVSEFLLAASLLQDESEIADNHQYIMEHEEEILTSDEWKVFSENHWDLAEKAMLMKYKQAEST